VRWRIGYFAIWIDPFAVRCLNTGMNRLLSPLVFCVFVASLAAPAAAAEIGTLASLRGTVEIGRASTWTAMAPGDALQQGDRIRTGNPGQARIVFQDDTVLTLNEDTEIVLDENVFTPDSGESRSLTSLLRGAVNAVVSEYYGRQGSEYTIRTATATAGVRGTEFIVAYYPELSLAEVIGISGQVEVRSTLADIEETVYVTAEEVSQVSKGAAPTAPQPFSGELMQERLQRFDIVGTSRIETLAAWQGGVGVLGAPRGRSIESFSARQERIRRPQDASNLLSDSPAALNHRQLGVRF